MALEIIGPGFGRTGTNSLQIALIQLGFGPCHHMHEVKDNQALLSWEAASRGQPVDWDEIFAGYRAQVDWPGARYWREITAHYPSAKVILTVRDPDQWFNSVQSTIAPYLANRGKHQDDHENAVADMAERTVNEQVFGGKISDRDAATRIFRNHIAEVQGAIPGERLLTFDVKEGWAPLCEFLQVAVPDTPFPKTNSTREFNDEVSEKR